MSAFDGTAHQLFFSTFQFQASTFRPCALGHQIRYKFDNRDYDGLLFLQYFFSSAIWGRGRVEAPRVLAQKSQQTHHQPPSLRAQALQCSVSVWVSSINFLSASAPPATALVVASSAAVLSAAFAAAFSIAFFVGTFFTFTLPSLPLS